METVQTAFVLLVCLVLALLLIDALLTGSVWVKGSRRGIVSFRSFGHKRDKIDEPVSYWFAVGFYAVALVVLLYAEFLG